MTTKLKRAFDKLRRLPQERLKNWAVLGLLAASVLTSIAAAQEVTGILIPWRENPPDVTEKGLYTSTSEEREASVYGLIAQRLDLMKSVAAWKHVNGIAVEDREREAIVLARATTEAAKHGLASATVRPFFEAQIEAAKAIQRCWIAHWSSGSAKPPADPPDLKTDIRPKLIEIGNSLNAAILGALGDGLRFGDDGATGFARAVQLDCLDRESRGAIYAALTRIQLAPSSPKPSVAPVLATDQTVLGQPITYPGADPMVTAVIVTLPPGAETGWHRHRGPLFGYMLEGELTVAYEGAGERIYRPGDALMEAITTPHNGHNRGDNDVRILAVFIGAKDLPNSEKVE